MIEACEHLPDLGQREGVFAVYKDCLPAAERGDVYDLTGRVNGPKRLKLAEREAATARAYKVLSK